MRCPAQGFNRREFVRTVSTGLAAFPVLGADLFGQTQAPRRSRVVLVRTSDRKKGVAEVLKLMDLRNIAGKRVVLKPNYNTADPTPSSTHNDTLTQLITEIRARNARSITLGESSGGGAPVRTVMERMGTFDLARDLRFDIVNFEEMPESDWVLTPAAGTHWPNGFHLPRLVVNSEYTISMCNLKTHHLGYFTMALKLSVGMTPKPIRKGMHASPDARLMIAELNTAYKPNLIVLDGIAAFTDGGPAQGELKVGNVMIAGDDRVAVDAVGVAMLKSLGSNERIMGTRIFGQEQIARAVELKLGATGPDAIEIVTPPDAESRAVADTLRPILAQG